MIGVRTAIVAAALALATVASAQSSAPPAEKLAPDRPEAWAQEYFTSVSFLTGLGTPADERPGSISLELEAGWIPSLTPAEEEVGFAGTAAEDLNKAPVLFRPRVRVALPARFSVIVGGVPPVSAFGVTPRLAAAAVEWTMLDREPWRLAWRVHGQTGTVTGAFTCSGAALAAPPGSPANPTGCGARSADVVTLRYGAVEFDAARRLTRFNGLTPHVSVSLNAVDSRFQVHALTFGSLDQTVLDTTGVTASFSGGAAIALGSRVTVAADAFYSPLMVRRQPNGGRSVDGLFNIRGLISYRIHR